MKILLSLVLALTFSSCATYKIHTNQFNRCEVSKDPCQASLCRDEREAEAAKHWLYQVIPRHRSQIRWYDLGHWSTWMLFGNDDDGIFGESIGSPYEFYAKNNAKKAAKWWLRNPLHNLTHYAIGSAGTKNREFTLLNIHSSGITCLRNEKGEKHNFGSEGTSFYAGLHGGKPYLSLRVVYPWKRKTECYIGWRKGGAFGLKFLPMINEEKHKSCFKKPQNNQPLDPPQE